MRNLRIPRAVKGPGGILGLIILYWILYRDNKPDDRKTAIYDVASTNYRYPHSYPYLTQPGAGLCGTDKVEVLIMVSTALKHTERRRAIRETWGASSNLIPHNIKIFFMLGTTEELNPTLESDLLKESLEFSDIVREQFIDSYSNLTLKSIGGIKWTTQFCSQAKFFMKTDDDIYLNIPMLTRFLGSAEPRSRVIHGCVKNGPQGSHQPISVSGASFTSVHPPFTAGAGYIISGDIIQELSNVSQNIKIIRVEDAFLTGHCASRVGGIQRVHNNIFSCGQLVNRNCDMKTRITGHKITSERMRIIQDELENNLC